MGSWFRRYRQVMDPKIRLVCFPHAGGGPSVFRTWPGQFPASVEILPVHYPGRQDRIAEECVQEMGALADAITEALYPQLDRPVAMLGHSLGAWVAYEVAVRVLQRYHFRLDTLFVSGQTAPHRPGKGKVPETDDEILETIRRLGGHEAAAAEDPELMELAWPAIQADFAVHRGYRHARGAMLTCPIIACFGDQDEDIEDPGVRAWAELTTGHYSQQVFPGGHFYLIDQELALTHAIASRIAG